MAVIYRDDGTGLAPIAPLTFERESALEDLVAKNPHLISDCLQEEDSTPWLLVTSRAGIQRRADDGDHYEADLLFVAGDGTPTIVEVKRSTDTRIRREVVAQMLDYAANGLRYWPAGHWRTLFEQRVGAEADKVLRKAVGSSSPDDFWKQVDANFKGQNLRLVLLADHVPQETRRMIDFLNDDSKNLEFVAIEIRPYTLEGRRHYVPQPVAGLRAIDAPRRRQARAGARSSWTKEQFLEQVPAGKARDLAIRVITEFETGGKTRPWYGSGATHASMTPRPLDGTQGCITIYPYGGGVIELKLNWQKDIIVDAPTRQKIEAGLAECLRPGALTNIGPLWEKLRHTVPLTDLRDPDGPMMLARWAERVHDEVVAHRPAD